MRPITWNRRPKKASLIASSDSASRGRGVSSHSQSVERGLRGGSGIVALISSAPSAKRKPYCATQGSEPLSGSSTIVSLGANAGARAV